MAMWNPWRGCRKYSEGCKFCYIHKSDKRKGINTNNIEKTDNFYAPINKGDNDKYIIAPYKKVYLCFSSDFFIEEADRWREECWEMMRVRKDLHFVFLTKRIERFYDCVPSDWGKGYSNVTIGCTVENQELANYRLSIFSKLPIKHKNIICQPLIDKVTLSEFLDDVEMVIVGGESDANGRPLNYDWVLKIREQCIDKKVNFEFRQSGTNFIKDDKKYKIKVKDQAKQAKRANINYCYGDKSKLM
jgi:protein gp37